MNPVTAKRHIKVVTVRTTDGVFPQTDDNGQVMTKTTVHPLSAKGHFERLNQKLPPALRHKITEHAGDVSNVREVPGAPRRAETGRKLKPAKGGDDRFENDDVLNDDSLNMDGGAHAAANSEANSNAPEKRDVADDENVIDDIQQHEINGINPGGKKGEKGTAPKKTAAPKKAAPTKAASKKGK